MNLYILSQKFKRGIHRVFVEPMIQKAFANCGKGVRVPQKCSFEGIDNICVGNNVSFGQGTTILSTKAKLIIGNDVMFGPNVTIVTGNHRIDMVGRTMISITENEKLPENDQDVIIEDDVWIGANATLLKGVTVHIGSVVAAGAIVTKDIPPYQIWGGGTGSFLSKQIFGG